MKYAFLIHDDPSSWESLPEEERQKLRAEEMPRWEAAMGELGSVDPSFTGFELDGASTAKVVRVRDGERIVSDGPFVETKEIIGGLFVAEVPDLDEAIRLAAVIPSAAGGAIEIRPVIG
jgi:hypothetical protein